MEYDVSAATKASTPDIVPQDVEALSEDGDKPVSLVYFLHLLMLVV